LQRLLAAGSFTKEHCRIQALLWLAAGQSVKRIAEVLGVSRRTVYYWAERFQQRSDLALADRFADAPRSGRPATALDIIDPLIAAAVDLGSVRSAYLALAIPGCERLRQHAPGPAAIPCYPVLSLTFF
jgi:hypothetical protein